MREEEKKEKREKEERRGKEGEGEGLMQEKNSQHNSGVEGATPGLRRCA